MATISQRISIEGGEDIRKQLEALAKAASAAFAQIQGAVEKIEVDPKTEQAFADLAAAGSKLVEQFGGVAEAASDTAPEVEDVGKAAATAAEGFAKLGAEGSKAAGGITAVGGSAEKASTGYADLALNVVRTGAAVGSTVAGITSAGAATATLGVQTVTAAAAVGTFALGFGSTLVAAIGVAVGALGVLGAALERIAFDNARLSNTLDHLALTTRGIGQSFGSLQVGQAAFEQIGISAEKFRSVIANIAKELEGFKAADAFQASADKIRNATIAMLEAEKALLEVQIAKGAFRGDAGERRVQEVARLLALANKTDDIADAEKRLAKAREESTKAAANNLTTIVELMQQIEGKTKAGDTFIGPVRPTFDALTTLETKIEAIRVRLQDVANTGGDVGKALLKIIANLPKEDAFKVGAAFGLSETDIDRVRRYGAEVTKIDNLNQKIRSAGPLISPESAAGNERMIESTQRLDSAWQRLKQAWSSTIFSDLAASATTTFNNMTARVVEFAAQVVESFNMLSGQLFTTLGQIASGWGTIFGMIGQGWLNIFSMIGSGLGILGQRIATFVTTAAGGAWQWIVSTFNSAVDGTSTKIGEAKSWIDQFVLTPTAGAWQWIVSTFDSAVNRLPSLMARGRSLVDQFVLTPTAGAWQWIVDKWNAMLQGLRGGGGAASSGAAAAPTGTGLAGGGLLGGRGTGTSDSNLAWVSRGEYIIPARVVRQPGVLALLEALRRSGNLPRFAGGGLVPAFASGGEVPKTVSLEKVQQTLKQVAEIMVRVAQSALQFSGSINETLRGIAFRVFDQMQALGWRIYDNAQSIDQGLNEAMILLKEQFGIWKGMAGGGVVGGRGTGTSDSNLAWLSRGEYVVPARAVAQPGVLAFLEALRRTGGGNLRDLLDGMGRFAFGGLVRAPISIPAFAGGGSNRDLGTLHLALPSGQTFAVRASSDVVDELRRAAALGQVRSGGRKPSRYS